MINLFQIIHQHGINKTVVGGRAGKGLYIPSLICQRHFQNYAIKEFIESNGRGGKCKYCGDGYSEEESPLVASFDELMVLIVDGISRAFLVTMEHQSASLCIL